MDYVFAVPGLFYYSDRAVLSPDGQWRSEIRQLTLSEMQTEDNEPMLQLMSMDEWSASTPSLCSEPKVITKTQFKEMRDVLPPEDWHQEFGSESFKMCERLSGRITSIYCRIGTTYYHLANDFSMSHSAIVAACQKSNKSASHDGHWLDKHITDQAAHYGMTVERKADVFNAAAQVDELILCGAIDEDDLTVSSQR